MMIFSNIILRKNKIQINQKENKNLSLNSYKIKSNLLMVFFKKIIIINYKLTILYKMISKYKKYF